MPRYARRVGLLLAARRHEWAPPFGSTFFGRAAMLPRAQRCCGAPTRRNGVQPSLRTDDFGPHAPRRFVALVCRYASKANRFFVSHPVAKASRRPRGMESKPTH